MQVQVFPRAALEHSSAAKGDQPSEKPCRSLCSPYEQKYPQQYLGNIRKDVYHSPAPIKHLIYLSWSIIGYNPIAW